MHLAYARQAAFSGDGVGQMKPELAWPISSANIPVAVPSGDSLVLIGQATWALLSSCLAHHNERYVPPFPREGCPFN